jgi:membrane-associated phospholipid phosphatase
LKPAFVLLLGGLLAASVAPRPSFAQAVQPHEALEDTKLYFTAPLRWDGRDWLEFAGTLVAIGVAHEFDDEVRDHFAGDSADGLGAGDSHDASDYIPTAVVLAGTWLLAGVTDDPGGWREFGSMAESGLFSLASTEILKYAFGRERPNQTTDPDAWFESGSSFPSRHAALAFAVGTVFAESGNDDYRWIRRVIGYGMATATAYARLDHNVHWASDVVAGAALGISTARFTMNRREGVSHQSTAMVLPAEGGGIMLSFAVPLH